jgi:glycosyltransferase involved in cell wall biosynthesis
MMEAMLAGCVPVVADCGSPSFIVTDECGFRIPVASQRRMVAHLADALIAIDRDREIIRQKGRAASRRIADGFTEEAYRATVNAVYRSLKRI